MNDTIKHDAITTASLPTAGTHVIARGFEGYTGRLVVVHAHRVVILTSFKRSDAKRFRLSLAEFGAALFTGELHVVGCYDFPGK